MSEPIHNLAAGEIRARKRPGAIVLLYLWELAFALLIATPIHAWARRAWGSHPDGDAVLWKDGGRALLTWLGQVDAALPVVSRTAIVLLVVGAVFSQLPLGALLASLAFERGPTPPNFPRTLGGQSPRAGTAMRAGMNAFFPLVVVLAFLAVTNAIVLGLGTALASAMDHGFERKLGDAQSFQLHVAVVAFFFLISAFAGVFVDLARAAIGREAGLASMRGSVHPAWNMMLRGIRVAITTSRNRGIYRALRAWAVRAGSGVVLLAIGWIAASSLGGKGGGALIALWVIHQGVVLGRVALRASWLAHATRMIVPAQDELLEIASTAPEGAKPYRHAAAVEPTPPT